MSQRQEVLAWPEIFEACSNAGRWGNGDARGTLNYIDQAVVLRGLSCASAGEVVALGTLPPPHPFDADAPVRLQVYASDPSGRDAADVVAISPHGFEITHLDAIGHSFFEGTAYNHRSSKEVFDESGLQFGGIDAMAGGIVTRGVLLDVERSRGIDGLVDGAVTASDLSAAEAASGTTVLPGDAVFVRSGIDRGGPDVQGRRPGLVADAVIWLHERQVAVYSGDCIERMPGDDRRLPMVLHQVGHVAMGLAILDNPDMAALRAACDRHDRSEFLLVVAPLRLEGATGCAVNPLAVF